MTSHALKEEDNHSTSKDTIRVHLDAFKQAIGIKEEHISELQAVIEELETSNAASQEQIEALTAERDALREENCTTRDNSNWLRQANGDLHDEVVRLEAANRCLRSDNVPLLSDIRSDLATLGYRINAVETKVADEAAKPNKFKADVDSLRRHADKLEYRLDSHYGRRDRPRYH